MKTLSSISLMFMSLGFFILGMLFENVRLKIVVLTAAAIVSIAAAIKSFQEKKKNK
ncbi:MAG: hypothetical protein KAF41_12855 [Flavobacterium sp.]|uniref:hypothetical protein n=1 Tax=Flavobacterium sp. Leaf359 TaxID=1736351 RepID=UPI000A947BD8|nr:hypothetical protein [Flavobacterium sp. Leaf359]MBU7571518.1 hypothetical protein [Flavobacterium sp.]